MNDFLQSLRNGQAEKPRTPKTRKNTDNSYQYNSPPRFHSYGGYQNNRNQSMKRPPAQYPAGNQLPVDETSTTALLADAIENLSSHIESLTKNQDYLISVQERTADMIERQAIAIEKIVGHLNIAPPEQKEELKKELKKEAAPQKPFKHHYVTSRKPKINIPAPIENTEPVKPFVEPIKPKKPVVRRRKKIVAKKTEQTVTTDKKLLSREVVMDIIQSMRAEGATFDQVASRLIELGQPTFSGRGEWHAQTIHRLCNKK
jgi:hypothetical protein